MKFDHDLIEKIGATHYDGGGYLYKVERSRVLFRSESDGRWKDTASHLDYLFFNLKPIPPRLEQSPEYEYVPVKLERDSLAVIALENGQELYAKGSDD